MPQPEKPQPEPEQPQPEQPQPPPEQHPPTSEDGSLNQSQLAQRLGCNQSSVSRARKKGEPAFIKWSQQKDPQGIGWKFNPKTSRFTKVEELQ